MKTEDRLRAALDHKAAAATPSPTAYADVKERVTRRRAVTRLQVAGAALATVAVAVGAVALVDNEQRSTPPASSPTATASVDKTPAPTQASTSPTPAATPSGGSVAIATTPLPGAVPMEDYVALLTDGRLITASARTGTTTAVLATLPRPLIPGNGDLAVSPDRRRVYFPTDHHDSADAPCDRLVWVLNVTTGDVSALMPGSNPQLSPDGERLAVERGCDLDEWLVVRTLANDVDTSYMNDDRHGGTDEGPWRLDDLAWHADSRRIWVVMDWEDSPELRLLDPSTDRTLRDADDVATQHGPRFIERRGDELAYIHTCCYPESTEDAVLYLRSTAGQDREVVRSPATGRLSGLQVGPEGDLLYVQSGRLHRLDPDSGETLDLGPSTALARDW